MCKKVILILNLLCLLVLNVFSANERFTLVIDAGHGGHDAGALGTISKEKNINLAVAMKFGKYVEQNLLDVKVVYTRKTDIFVPLHERANIANRANADLFISVHTNALPAGKIARGFETYTLGMHRAKDNLDVAMRENSVISMEKGYQQTYQGFDPKSSESYIIFEFIQGKNMERSVDIARFINNSVCSNANRPNKGVHQAGFLVLRETSMPSCLIELGFITTPDEEQLLNNNARVEEIAKSIYLGFLQYKEKYDNRVLVPFKPTVTAESQTISSFSTDNNRKHVDDNKLHSKQTTHLNKKDDAQEYSPIFKVQILVSNRTLRSGDSHLKGETDYDSYQEGGLRKYTIGSSHDYNEIYSLRKSLLQKFPECFIIAFKGGQKYDVNQAIREFKRNKK